jgi:hypothetical protein
MIDQEMVRFLEAKVAEAREELERRQRAFQEYIGTPPDLEAEGDQPQPRDIWAKVLATGIHLSRQELLDLLHAAGWTAKYEQRAFSRAINTNVSSGNLAVTAEGRYYQPDPEEKQRILNEWRDRKNTSSK